MEDKIKILREKYNHIYIKICGYLDMLPVGRGVMGFYPLTCRMCPRFQNRSVVCVFDSRFRECRFGVRGFCSESCYREFTRRGLERGDVENNVRIGRWRYWRLKEFEGDFGLLARLKMKSIPEKIEMPIVKYKWRGMNCTKTIVGSRVYYRGNLVDNFSMIYDYKIDPFNI